MTMIDSSALRAFRNALQLMPVAWVLWALDAEERYVFVEGPCLERIGMHPAEILGRFLTEVHPANPVVVAWARTSMRGPVTDRLVVNGYELLLSGAPSHDGGSVGIGMLLEEAAPPLHPAPKTVMELACDVPQVEARRGDLLVLDSGRPGRVGLYREIDLSQLPLELEAEVRRLSRASCAEGRRASPAGTPGRPPARASHLQLLS